MEARVLEKNEEIHHRTNFIFGTSWNEKTWDNNMLNLIQVFIMLGNIHKRLELQLLLSRILSDFAALQQK